MHPKQLQCDCEVIFNQFGMIVVPERLILWATPPVIIPNRPKQTPAYSIGYQPCLFTLLKCYLKYHFMSMQRSATFLTSVRSDQTNTCNKRKQLDNSSECTPSRDGEKHHRSFEILVFNQLDHYYVGNSTLNFNPIS